MCAKEMPTKPFPKCSFYSDFPIIIKDANIFPALFDYFVAIVGHSQPF